MNLKNFWGKHVKIIDKENEEYSGIASEYFYPEDNDPEYESIIVDSQKGSVEFYEADIKEIVVI